MSDQAKAQILVIEDNNTNRELMVYLLKAFGHSTTEARDGAAGVAAARNERPDLILCDVHLPKLDGYGVVRELKSDDSLRNVPVVAVTALAMVGDRDRILASGFDGYISKPIAPESFITEVQRFLTGDHPPLSEEDVRAAGSAKLPEQKAGGFESLEFALSHDLRAPLRAIDGFARVLLDDFTGELPKVARDHLRTIRNEARRAAGIIDNLLQSPPFTH